MGGGLLTGVGGGGGWLVTAGVAAGEVTVGVAIGVTVAAGTGDVIVTTGEAVGRGVGAGAAAMIGAGAGADTWGAHCAAVAGAVITAMRNKACLARCKTATRGTENKSANKYYAMVAGVINLVLKTLELDK